MVHGLGVDVVEIDRIRRAYKRFGQRLVNRLLGEREQSIAATTPDRVQFLAGRFAAKEALIKALGTMLDSRPSWPMMQILPDDQGRPVISLAPGVVGLPRGLRFHVSISHERKCAVAVVIAESESGGTA